MDKGRKKKDEENKEGTEATKRSPGRPPSAASQKDGHDLKSSYSKRPETPRRKHETQRRQKDTDEKTFPHRDVVIHSKQRVFDKRQHSSSPIVKERPPYFRSLPHTKQPQESPLSSKSYPNAFPSQERHSPPRSFSNAKQQQDCPSSSSSSPPERPHSVRSYAESARPKQTNDGETPKGTKTKSDSSAKPRSVSRKSLDSLDKVSKQMSDLTISDKLPVSDKAIQKLTNDRETCTLSAEDISVAAEAMNSFITEFIKKLNELSDLRWQSFNSGSYYDQTKNEYPDEFDIMIYPDLTVAVDFDDVEVPGFYKVKLITSRVEELKGVCDKDNYLLPKKFKEYVFGLFECIVEDKSFRQGRRTRRKETSDNSPAFTIYYSAIPGKPQIDVDLVPCFNIIGWPDKVANRINPKWIVGDKVVQSCVKSYDVVCKGCPEEKTRKKYLWRLSFSRAEKLLVKHANQSDPLKLRKSAFRNMKLCIQKIKEKNQGKITKFCSYHIKQFMLMMYDIWLEKETCQVTIQRNLVEALIGILSSAPPVIPNYFISGDNVMKHVPKTEIDLIIKGLREANKVLY